MQLTLNAFHAIDASTVIDALAYVRSSKRRALNGDVADDGGSPAALNRGRTGQSAWGLAANLSRTAGAHHLHFGFTLDGSSTRYRQEEQEGTFNARRGVIPADEEAELSVKVAGDALAFGLYAMDTWRITPATAMTFSARFNAVRVSNTLSNVDDDIDELVVKPKETFHYRSLNPAVGITHDIAAGPTMFANVSRNNRVPTVIELGCADPDEPCRLPAGLQSDPYLKQIVSTSVEGGMRWRLHPDHHVTLALYRTDNRDDILFSSVSSTSQLGYFRNFGKTRHQGVDVRWDGRFGAVQTFANYSHLNATYESGGMLRIGERNVVVTPGTRIAGLPRHTLRAGLDWQLTPAIRLGADARLESGRVVQGNEDGRVADHGTQRVDLGLPSFAVFNVSAAWQVRPGVEWLVRVDNVFDKRYETYGALAETVFDAQGGYTGDERDAVFVGPGAPRAVYATLRVRF